MISGTEHPNELAACTPYNPDKAAQTGKTYGLFSIMSLGAACIALYGQDSTFSLHAWSLRVINRHQERHTFEHSSTFSAIYAPILIFPSHSIDHPLQRLFGPSTLNWLLLPSSIKLNLFLLKSHQPAPMCHLTPIPKDSVAAIISSSHWI